MNSIEERVSFIMSISIIKLTAENVGYIDKVWIYLYVVNFMIALGQLDIFICESCKLLTMKKNTFNCLYGPVYWDILLQEFLFKSNYYYILYKYGCLYL